MIPKRILGIETSCDETGVAIYQQGNGLLSNLLFSQIDIHRSFGGVVPELASRSHIKKLSLITNQALQKALCSLKAIDVIAVTSKPGLPGSLSIGTCFAKALAGTQNKPIIAIDHLEGHIFSACIENVIPFPFLCITASGGHTNICYVKGFGNYHTLGTTLDDAAGEAFDKIAKLLELGYPGGPIIEQYAHQVHYQDFFTYPRHKNNGMQFSFSGLKTAVLYDLVRRDAYDLAKKKLLNTSENIKQKVSSSLLVCIGDIFVQKLKRAFDAYPDTKAFVFVGGVACNKYLRTRLQDISDIQKRPFFVPSPLLCTDNGAMIAFVGSYKAEQKKFDRLDFPVL